MTYEVSIELLTVQFKLTVEAPQEELVLVAEKLEIEQGGIGGGVGITGQF